MILLAIDTAGADCAAALYCSSSQTLLASTSERIGRGHAERLMGMIDDVLAAAGKDMQDIGRIAVVIGPGSFTGIRVGLAAARGLALALSVDIVGVTTLAAIAAAHQAEKGPQPVIAAMDAKRDEVYVQSFGADGAALDAAAMISHDELRTMVAETGFGVAGSGRTIIGLDGPEDGDCFPLIQICRLGAAAPVSGKPKPLYLRGPDAKPQTGYAVARA
ncbi:tRNA (adenosine(37)-N6)-threonylcarbamoyltransferase complex dimerization subunit type 1 TsaB [Allorhizobium undicola]|uniref:tRNA (adenosine(37)-N6)-threonylcarbamoyltransferase complex dimerization subunit type 1 TsaB n=1 Tax=Allorhizobium undicola TaxID=78527 RepID=UPI00048181F5|nr:tRNA (adenosine(37)-N6)-threonylcarbamoyltransferase complex dimerization subunit type 1 TsaB [Allorhizobium undicola]